MIITSNLPPLPDSIGKIRSHKSRTGETKKALCVDEVKRIQSSDSHKGIVIQKLQYENLDGFQYRFGYYLYRTSTDIAARKRPTEEMGFV